MSKLPALVLSVVVLASGGAASAVVNGAAFDDRLRGTNGSDTMRGRPGNDKLNGLDGDDLLRRRPRPRHLNGGQGLDDIGGGAGNDVLAGRRLPRGPDLRGDRRRRVYGFRDDQVSAVGQRRGHRHLPQRQDVHHLRPGRDEVVFNQTPPAGTFTDDDCEDVHVESAG